MQGKVITSGRYNHFSWCDSLLQDMRFTARTLRRQPTFVAVSVLSLALGIGINVSVVSYLNALFLRPLPGVPDSGRLVSVYLRTAAGAFSSCSYPDYEYCRDHNRLFSGVLAYLRIPMTLRAGDQTEQVFGELVSDDYFPVMGLQPAIGRLLGAGESAPVAVLSHDFWVRHFGGDKNITGRSVRIGNGVFTIVGVAPPGFRGIVVDWDEPPVLWVPLAHNRSAVPPFREFDILGSWGMQSFQVVARMRPGVGLRAACGEIAGLTARLLSDHPERRRAFSDDGAEYRDAALVGLSTIRTRFWPGHRGNLINFLGLLSGVAILILLISWFNVANLVLTRAANRRAEFSVRLSLGASRMRVMRQLVTENLILSALGAGAGLLIAEWASRFLAGFGRVSHVPLSVGARVDIRVLAFAAGLSIVVGVVLALVAARAAARGEPNTSLKADSRTAGLQRLRINRALVVAQVSVSIILLIGAGLFVRTLKNAKSTDITLRPEQVLLSTLDLGSGGYDEKRGSLFYTQLLERLRALPGVRDAALVFVVPLGGRRGGTNIVPEDQTTSVQVGFNIVTPGYFRTIGIPVVRGRVLADTDREGTAAVAVINDEMAHRLYPGKDPIGERFLLKWSPAAVVEIVGVVKDGKFRDYRSSPEPTVYVPLAQRYNMVMNLEVRTAGNPAGIARSIRREIGALDKDLPLLDLRTLAAHLDGALAQERLSASLLTSLGCLALILVAIGIYGVLAYTVARRTREIGIRIALGAQARTVVADVLGDTLRLVGAGVLIGVVTALFLGRLIKALLYGLSPADPFVLAVAVAVLVAVAVIAALIPASRASRINPVSALRYE